MNLPRESSVLRNLNVAGIVLVLFIAHFDVGLSAISDDTDVYQGPSESDVLRWILASRRKNCEAPKEQETKTPEPQAPAVQIRLLKGHILPDESWGFSSEYVYSPKEYQGNEDQAETDEKFKEGAARDGEKYDQNEIEKNKKSNDQSARPAVPYIDSRNIITGPSFCPKGQRRDKKGRCRDVIPSNSS